MSVREEISINEPSRHSLVSLDAWREMIWELRDSRELIYRLWYRDLAGQFRQSFLGLVWLVLPPIATTVTFTFLRSAKIVNVPMEDQILPYVLFVLIGSTVWQMFASITMQVTTCIARAGALVSKIYFPREALAISALGRALIAVLIQSGVVLSMFAVLRFLPHWQVVLIPITLIPLAALSVGLGMMFAPVNSVVHDTSRVLNLLFQFAMFLAPTVYPTPSFSSIATDGWSLASPKTLFWLHTLNPVSHFINAARDLVQYGNLTHPAAYILTSGISLLILVVGWRFFHLSEPLVAERI